MPQQLLDEFDGDGGVRQQGDGGGAQHGRGEPGVVADPSGG
ncbi:hypothetical protein [Actinomadura sp. 9N407]